MIKFLKENAHFFRWVEIAGIWIVVSAVISWLDIALQLLQGWTKIDYNVILTTIITSLIAWILAWVRKYLRDVATSNILPTNQINDTTGTDNSNSNTGKIKTTTWDTN